MVTNSKSRESKPRVSRVSKVSKFSEVSKGSKVSKVSKASKVSRVSKKAQPNKSSTRYSLRSMNSAAAGKSEDVDDEPVYVAIVRYADDIATIESQKQALEEWEKNPMEMMHLDDRDHGNPAMVEKYGDKLPMRWGDWCWPPWEMWMDKIGQVYYFNTRTKEIRYGGPDFDEFDKPANSAEESLMGKRN